METVVLKNGSKEVKALVVVVMMSLEELIGKDPITFYELVMFCRDQSHKFFGSTQGALERLGFLQNGTVHDSVRNIVLSAVEGDGLEMRLRNPVQQALSGDKTEGEQNAEDVNRRVNL